MKTTIDLPDDLVRELKLRAVREGRKLKDAAAAAIRAGLAVAEVPAAAEKPAVLGRDKKTGLPLIQCRRSAKRDEELTPLRVAEIIAAQEAGWARDSG
jgi:plasmid stability protein